MDKLIDELESRTAGDFALKTEVDLTINARLHQSSMMRATGSAGIPANCEWA
jgi:hypothetical protein